MKIIISPAKKMNQDADSFDCHGLPQLLPQTPVSYTHLDVYKRQDVYYYANSPFGRNAAEIIADTFKEIYPNPDLVKAVPTTSLAEVTKTNAPAVLIETAYHDNPQDAEWIRTHIQEMAANLVKSLTDIFGIPFISTPVPERTGTVTTQSTPLNIRSRPNLNAPIIGQIPKGAAVKVLGQWENWYVVDYQGTVGYSSSDYITV